MPLRKGWFNIPGQVQGPRTPEEQMMGLAEILSDVSGKTVLDLGCAEGAIAARLIEAGAVHVDGVECNPELIDTAKQIYARAIASGALTLHRADLNNLSGYRKRLLRKYDIVLALSIAHKMADPGQFIASALDMVGDCFVIRLPKPVIRHVKSGFKPYPAKSEISKTLTLVSEPVTCRGEWMGLYRS